MSSPHTRGCFHYKVFIEIIEIVFPAYAGVFPFTMTSEELNESLPRIRGGVSSHFLLKAPVRTSSPHTRGCFLRQHTDPYRGLVFPAYAGVFLEVAIMMTAP